MWTCSGDCRRCAQSLCLVTAPSSKRGLASGGSSTARVIGWQCHLQSATSARRCLSCCTTGSRCVNEGHSAMGSNQQTSAMSRAQAAVLQYAIPAKEVSWSIPTFNCNTDDGKQCSVCSTTSSFARLPFNGQQQLLSQGIVLNVE